MKKTLVMLAVLLAAGCGAAYYLRDRGDTGEGDASARATATAERTPLRQEVSCSGTVESNLDVEIKCKATGQVVELPFDISDSVEKGALLLKVDPVDEERSVRQAEVKLASAEAKLARARQSLVVSDLELEKARKEAHASLKGAQASGKDLREKARRMAELRKKEYASPEEVESAEATAVQGEAAVTKASAGMDGIKVEENRLELFRQDIKLAEADVETCRIDLENTRQRLKETQVFAPVSGVVSERLVQVGQIISSPTMNVGGGTALLTLSDLSRVFVLASVDESDVGLVRPKQQATIRVDAFPDEVFQGEVVRVATKGGKVSNVVTFDVKIEVLGAGIKKLLPQMTADVEILAAEKESALSLPSEAVKRRGSGKVVLIPSASGGEPAPVPVTTGIDDGTRVEILSGLEEGAVVVMPEDDTGRDKAAEQKRGGFPGPPPGGGPPPM